MADILVANKTDLASAGAMWAFDELIKRADPGKSMVARTRFGRLNAAWLDLPQDDKRSARHPDHHSHRHSQAEQRKDGYQSHGWMFPGEIVFDFACLLKLFQELEAERVKAVMHTDQGWIIFNGQSSQIDATTIETALDNRLEIIHPTLSTTELESQISRCEQKHPQSI